MKIAVLITGQLRDYQELAQNHISHIIEPNNADLFVYASNKNTVHSLGQNLTQKYELTSITEKDELISQIKTTYGNHLTQVEVSTEEPLDDSNFGKLSYFRARMQNQMDNVRRGFEMAQKHAKEHGFEYDMIVRCRPDNCIAPYKILFSNFPTDGYTAFLTRFYSGHRDPWFFAAMNPETFNVYSSFKYLPDADGDSTATNFPCPEAALESWLVAQKMNVVYCEDLAIPLTGNRDRIKQGVVYANGRKIIL